MEAPQDPLAMPGAIQVHLRGNAYLESFGHFRSLNRKAIVFTAGETVFYNNNILHTATYDRSTKRATLHGCMGDTRGGFERANNILQHDLRWMRQERFAETFEGDDGERERLTGMWKRLLKMAGSVEKSGKQVEYSQVG